MSGPSPSTHASRRPGLAWGAVIHVVDERRAETDRVRQMVVGELVSARQPSWGSWTLKRLRPSI